MKSSEPLREGHNRWEGFYAPNSVRFSSNYNFMRGSYEKLVPRKRSRGGGGGGTRATRNLRNGADAQSFEIRQELLAGCSLGQASRLHLARVLQARLEQNHIVQIGVVDLPTAHRGHELGRYHDLPLDKQMYQR
jgi:hypothetical protein